MRKNKKERKMKNGYRLSDRKAERRQGCRAKNGKKDREKDKEKGRGREREIEN